MLTVDTVISTPAVALTLLTRCELSEVASVCRQARSFLEESGISEQELDSWELALGEAVNNAVTHCPPENRYLPIRTDILVSSENVEGRVSDHTPGFDYPENLELPPHDSETGRGLFLICNLVDEVLYLRGRNENCLVLRRRRHDQTHS